MTRVRLTGRYRVLWGTRYWNPYPTLAMDPSSHPDHKTNQPTKQPNSQPTNQPTIQPTNQPTNQPTYQPTNQPSNQPNKGSSQRCTTRNCKLCSTQVVVESGMTMGGIVDAGNQIHIPITLNCDSTNGIYCMVCSKCNELYVGETGLSFRKKINIHRSDVRLPGDPSESVVS